MRTLFACRCGGQLHRLSASRYLHDNGDDFCDDGGLAVPALVGDLPAGYHPETVLEVA